MRNCFLDKTPLQTSLCLVLLILVPFLISTIIIYVLGLKLSRPENDCSEFCEKINKTKQSVTSKYNPVAISSFTNEETTLSLNTITTSTTLTTQLGQIKRILHNPLDSDLDNPLVGVDYYPKSDAELLNPNGARFSYRDREKICPSDMRDVTKHPYIVAILRVLYIKNNLPTNLLYLCTGVIISKNWALSSYECLENHEESINISQSILIRAGSKYWSKGGVLHEVKTITKPPNIIFNKLLAFLTNYNFMNIEWVQPIHISRVSMYSDQLARIYGWQADEKLEFFKRKKNTPLEVSRVELHKGRICQKFKKQHIYFCATEIIAKNMCLYFTGSPVVKNGYLLGINVVNDCIKNSGSIYYILDVSYYYDWIKSLTDY